MTSLLSLAVVAFGLAGGSQPGAVTPAVSADGAGQVVMVRGDCSDAASRVVDQTGGQLLSAQPSSDGHSCIITVLVQGDGTSRPRKVRVQVPM
nr:hypothetical protein [uncultured Gellertiella sp.]